MLADWRSHLAALASYVASPADEALIVRLGDCLWEKQGQARLFQVPKSRCASPIYIMPFLLMLPQRCVAFVHHKLYAT